MKKSILIIFALMLCACTDKQAPTEEAFIPRETVEMEAIDLTSPTPDTQDSEKSALQALESDSMIQDQPLEPLEIPENAQDQTTALEEKASSLYPTTPRKVETLKGDQISITYFFDYTNPNAKALENMIKKIGSRYGSSLLWIYRPLGTDQKAIFAAKASECGRQQNAWPGFHEALLSLESQMNEETIYEMARTYPLNTKRFKTCLKDSKTAQSLALYQKQAQSFDITTTPAFVIGEDVVFAGAYPPLFFEQMIQSFLNTRLQN